MTPQLTFLSLAVVMLLNASISCKNYLSPEEEERMLSKVEEMRLNYTAFVSNQDIRSFSEEASEARMAYLTSGCSSFLQNINYMQVMNAVKHAIANRAYCAACQLGTTVLFNPIFTKRELAFALKAVCVTLSLQKTHICHQMIESLKDDLEYIRRRTKLTSIEFCDIFLGWQCSGTASRNVKWTLDIPPPIGPNNGMGSSASPQLRPDNSGYFVQISDLHVDPSYTPGYDAECGEPLCCRATHGPVNSSQSHRKAGCWADYRSCDVGLHVLDDALQRVSRKHSKARFWMITGDYAPHNVWSITRAEVKHVLKEITKLLVKYQQKGIPIFPLLGNHEGVPINSFPPPEVVGNMSISWLYDYVAEQWAPFLPEAALNTLRNYKINLSPDLVLLVINSNYCARLNFYSYLQPIDPANHLKWFLQQLQDIEAQGQRVHIAMHIPIDNRECTQAWLFNYLRIVERFEAIILGQYYGHTHADEFRVVYSVDDQSKPIGVQYVSPVITTFSHSNPSYRLYYMDESGALDRHETYYHNLTMSNTCHEPPIWLKLYDTKSFYNMSSLNAKGWHQLVEVLKVNEQTFQDFHRHYIVSSDFPEAANCNETCRDAILDDLQVDHPYNSINANSELG